MKTHTYRKTVATRLDQSGASARMLAERLGHSRISMTQDVYLGRRAGNAANPGRVRPGFVQVDAGAEAGE